MLDGGAAAVQHTFPLLLTKVLRAELGCTLYVLSPLINQCRMDVLGLRPVRFWEYWPLDSPRASIPFVYGYSPAVIPKPPDWGEDQHVTGYWFLDSKESFVADRALLEFLESGPPPVSIGFGSMVDHAGIDRLVLDALKESGQRAILLGGWSNLGSGDLPAFAFHVEAIPHDWLFPRVAAAIHHGGAGTTAAALRAGVPNVVVPWFGDQFFWGWRVHELGVGPKPLSRDRLTVSNLARAIEQASQDEDLRRNAADLGRRIRAEDGVGAAVSLIESLGYARAS